MINEIIYNPYRILGLYSNSSTREQVANKGKLQAYLKVNKSMSFPLDLTPLLPPLNRTEEMVQEADSKLTLPKDRVRHAHFWFINKTKIDEVAFNHLIAGDIIKAKEIWSKVSNMSSLQNQFVLELICACISDDKLMPLLSSLKEYEFAFNELESQGLNGSIQVAINKYLIPIYNEYINEFVSSVIDNFRLSKADFISNVLDTLNANGLFIRVEDLANQEWKDYIISKSENSLVQELEDVINKARSRLEESDAKGALAAGIWLKGCTNYRLKDLCKILGEDHTKYQLIADKVALTVIDCMVSYYNKTQDINAAAKALQLCDFAVEIAKGISARKRVNENRETIKEAFESMPPESVGEYSKEIKKLNQEYTLQAHDSANALELLRKARTPLIAIKTTLGNDHKYYKRISSDLANCALNIVIDDVNRLQDEISSSKRRKYTTQNWSFDYEESTSEQAIRKRILKIKKTLRDAWLSILHIDLLNLTDDFKKNQFTPNRNTLESIISSAGGFNAPSSNYYSTSGCCYGLSADKDFLTTEFELYARCKNEESYKCYIAHFPNGTHSEEINQKIRKINNRRRIIGVSAVTIPFLTIIVFIAAFLIHSNHVDEERYRIAESGGINTLYKLSKDFQYSSIGKRAKERVEHICDSLFTIAVESGTKDGWLSYQNSVPKEYSKKVIEKNKALESIFISEETAWNYCESIRIVPFYEEYLRRYPNGDNSSIAEKRIVEILMEQVQNSEYGNLPQMDKILAKSQSTSEITIGNNTRHLLTMIFSGKDSKRVIINPNNVGDVSLRNGEYKMAVILDDPEETCFAGVHNLDGGFYDVEYYKSDDD